MSRSRLRAYLGLGRVSNLPTVWTNVAAGIVLSRAPVDVAAAARLIVALSLFYVAGMFLNDAFDRDVDGVERPERPIPSGIVTATEVFLAGGVLMAGGFALVAWNRVALAQTSWAPLGSAAVLAALIVVYDAWHKRNPASPFIMGLCRAAVYTTAALGAGGYLGPTLVFCALSLAGYVAGLTFIARQENRKSYRAGATLGLLSMPAAVLLVAPFHPAELALVGVLSFWVVASLKPLFLTSGASVGRSVARLIAGISLVDAVFVASTGEAALAAVCVLGAGATLVLQRLVAGT